VASAQGKNNELANFTKLLAISHSSKKRELVPLYELKCQKCQCLWKNEKKI
jgi:hypothetical protein